MKFYKHHIGDYIKDTSHLTLLEHGAYRRMLDLYYAGERPFSDDIVALSRLVRAASREEKTAVETVLREFFVKEGDCWKNKRADAEIATYQAQCKINQEVGRLGGRPRKNRIGLVK